MATEPVVEFAPAKINLTLHVTGRRADGYHLLDSLVVFAGVGDRVTLRRSETLELSIVGTQAAALAARDDNLVVQAARLMGGGVAITLDKVLPVSSGIGGGSADAAATLRAIARLTGQALPDADGVLQLGADVPACLAGRPVRMTGVGDRLHPLPALPDAWLVLVNPGVSVSTPEVFRALEARANPAMPDPLPDFPTFAALVGFLRSQRNDLGRPALQLAPMIGEVLAGLAAMPGCELARMSGSGATCFGLFATASAAAEAARRLRQARPGWWIAEAPVQK
ncbi:MAG: 4-(cytidine 5'-diphospho)-2-C-methyl-D-erythritol kinase [Tabrizicola sp.]|uniref:4-(cytidine 5'-diphospho)-2-C-methyl-D-erythritol kinase n=1 Tax=Tabrizicola sp. TaxID=2005166 RepID=UPI00273416A9|nr:4-(cytidine 5'-diphospho)-2-C-methyl-D-erythritol kinase [Tabrizicola sp.]MDP3262501.1 4-(cytidine 5'-diphospho)-2-C-methyl-D-erythritol kinase [Tabrizicola sp.]MDP3648479.1 4-(cytidine 5'-diphospho)-2-C-methyl-D-erythritol kinase [Paracoccaceae bacterium]MDZ4065909.1 4-(cytidine 5'-diphospho)-2-C-methyl-D-erythritol kinase [Tabrizicola sp.]